MGTAVVQRNCICVPFIVLSFNVLPIPLHVWFDLFILFLNLKYMSFARIVGPYAWSIKKTLDVGR
jgi:hypothetical protein